MLQRSLKCVTRRHAWRNQELGQLHRFIGSLHPQALPVNTPEATGMVMHRVTVA